MRIHPSIKLAPKKIAPTELTPSRSTLYGSATRWMVAALISSLMSGVSLASAGDAAAEEFARQTRVKYDLKEAAFRANDLEPILSRFYHPEVMSVGPDGSTHFGREELRPVYEQVISSQVKIESCRSVVNGDAGWDWVNFHVTPPPEAGEQPFTFKMLFLWERVDGQWWSHGEMYVMGEFQAGGHGTKATCNREVGHEKVS